MHLCIRHDFKGRCRTLSASELPSTCCSRLNERAVRSLHRYCRGWRAIAPFSAERRAAFPPSRRYARSVYLQQRTYLLTVATRRGLHWARHRRLLDLGRSHHHVSHINPNPSTSIITVVTETYTQARRSRCSASSASWRGSSIDFTPPQKDDADLTRTSPCQERAIGFHYPMLLATTPRSPGSILADPGDEHKRKLRLRNCRPGLAGCTLRRAGG
jgi:hypothetical protein